MVVGSFGPWAHVLGLSVGGTDGSNDGWFVVAAAVIAAAAFVWQRETARAGVAAIVGGALGAIATGYDWSNLKDAAAESSELADLVEVGWGLQLALVASVSLAVAGVVWVLEFDEREHPMS
jgi:Na+/proline symporter